MSRITSPLKGKKDQRSKSKSPSYDKLSLGKPTYAKLSQAKFAARSNSKAMNLRSSTTSVGPASERHLTAFGERLVTALQSKGMNDSDLAKAMGIAQPNIHTLKYKTDRPRSATVMRIAKILGLAPEDLLPTSHGYGDASETEGTKVYLVIESKSGRQTIRLA